MTRPAPDALALQLAGLLAQCALKNQRAFAELYQLTSAKLYGVALRILRRQDWAEEVLQECYVNIRIKVVQEHPVMAAGTTWELWMLPGGKAAPVSMGLINTGKDQVMKLQPALAHKMGGAWGMAMSVEPMGGSPTGAPTGPVIFKASASRSFDCVNRES